MRSSKFQNVERSARRLPSRAVALCKASRSVAARVVRGTGGSERHSGPGRDEGTEDARANDRQRGTGTRPRPPHDRGPVEKDEEDQEGPSGTLASS